MPDESVEETLRAISREDLCEYQVLPHVGQLAEVMVGHRPSLARPWSRIDIEVDEESDAVSRTVRLVGSLRRGCLRGRRGKEI